MPSQITDEKFAEWMHDIHALLSDLRPAIEEDFHDPELIAELDAKSLAELWHRAKGSLKALDTLTKDLERELHAKALGATVTTPNGLVVEPSFSVSRKQWDNDGLRELLKPQIMADEDGNPRPAEEVWLRLTELIPIAGAKLLIKPLRDRYRFDSENGPSLDEFCQVEHKPKMVVKSVAVHEGSL